WPAGTSSPSSCGSGSLPDLPSRSALACSTRSSCPKARCSDGQSRLMAYDVNGCRVVVAGVGVTGQSVALVLAARGAHVVALDAAAGSAQQEAKALLEAAGVEVALGSDAVG